MKIILLQVLIFALGVMLMVVDGSGGHVENMTRISYTGAALCILGIGFTFIKGGVQILIEKIKNKKS